jgi:hypothetical protein
LNRRLAAIRLIHVGAKVASPHDALEVAEVMRGVRRAWKRPGLMPIPRATRKDGDRSSPFLGHPDPRTAPSRQCPTGWWPLPSNRGRCLCACIGATVSAPSVQEVTEFGWGELTALV